MRRIYRFLLYLTLCWLIILPLWLYLVSPHYGALLTTAANFLIGWNPINNDEASYEYVPPCVKGNIQFDVVDAKDLRKGRGSLRFTMDGERFQFNLTIWVALVLATPFDGKWRRKLLILFFGWVVIFLFQELDLFLQTQDEKLSYWLGLAYQHKFLPPGASDRFMASLGKYFLLVGYVVVPIAVWLPVGVKHLRMRVEEKSVLRKDL